VHTEQATSVLWHLVNLRHLSVIAGVGRASQTEGKVFLHLYFAVSQWTALVGDKFGFFTWKQCKCIFFF